jgi:succinoglycan biosynthesis transport protein ExoP
LNDLKRGETITTDRGHRDGSLQSSSLRDYLRVVRRRKWIILQAVVLVPLAAVAFSLRQPNLYQASSQVLLSNQNLASALTGTQQSTGVSLQADRVAQTQADLARVPQVANATLTAVGLHRSPAELLSHSSVAAKQNADLLQFSVTDHDPALAARLATAYAGQFVRYRQQLDTASLQRARSEVQQKIDALTEQRGPLYQSLVEKDQQLATMEALQTSNASVVQNAQDAAQVQPRPVRNGVLGLALGLVLGIGLAFLWEALDTRVRSAEEIGEQLGVPLLARLPEPSRRLRKEDQLVMLAEPRGAGAEAFRMLRTNLEFVRLGRAVKTIMVTSAVEQEGKSTSVANLAVALASAGRRVALIDLDLRRPYLDRFFDPGRHPGLTHVAIGQASLEEALIPVPIGLVGEASISPSTRASGNGNGHVAVAPAALHGGSLRVLTAGLLPPNAGEFVGSQALAAILDELAERFDSILIDAPPALQVGDAMALSANVDALLLVTRMNVVRRPMLHELRRLIDSTPAHVLGFIVTGARSEEGYGYGYGYGAGYSSSSLRQTEAQATR